MSSHARRLLSQQGPFAQLFDNYAERESQLVMTEAVEQALAERRNLIVDAATGTGKTFAYLVPAVELDGKSVISTGTKNLQDQLFEKDLPHVFKALNKKRRVALLKGRQNYLCSYRMDSHLHSTQFSYREMAEQLVKVKHWSESTQDGDLSTVNFLTDDSAIKPYITSNADNCLGGECDHYQQCFVARARKQALEADIIVVNHHLLMADLVLKEDGFGELLPKVDAYIVDEAHQLPDVASTFFGKSLSSRQLNELSKDCILEYLSDSKDCRELKDLAEQLEKITADCRLHLGDEAPRQFWRNFKFNSDVNDTFEQLRVVLAELEELLKSIAIRSRELENLHARSSDLLSRLELFISANRKKLDEKNTDVQWIEIYRTSFILNSTPLNIYDAFTNAQKPYDSAAWVLTSATLSVANNFQHFTDKLGFDSATQVQLDSPFNYPEQGLFYQPRFMKNPSDVDYTRHFVEHMLPLLRASKGRAFLLFTSHRALNQAAELLANHPEFNCFVQGQASKSHMLEQFKIVPNGVLLGTFSFWEGVDVAGDALSLVAIDKLPFSSPGDPLNQARINQLRQQGKDAFGTFQLPDAIIALKQGAGRLIRGTDDKGVLVIADPRLVGRDYGAGFIHDLPPLLPTRNKQLVIEYLEHL
ncbi:MAG: ATP-dependent DNA helicase [Kangiellaceae bacterium]|jgi:ATP-dependent DNA helicase DinG|nr:ATP-dependent DNA helicase [Kangiellaceae bacterium]